MTELTTDPAEQPEVPPLVVAPVETEPEPAVLITTQQVLLGTAAATARSPRRSRRLGRMVHAVEAVFDRPAEPPYRPPRHYPARHTYLEQSLMAREMRRL